MRGDCGRAGSADYRRPPSPPRLSKERRKPDNRHSCSLLTAPPPAMRPFLRTAVIAALLVASFSAPAQDRSRAQPVPEPPPPPPGFESDPALEPQITIRKSGEDQVEEYRIGGRLYMIKVTPPGGRPYYMIDQRGDGKFSRQESHDSGLRPPMWVIHQF